MENLTLIMFGKLVFETEKVHICKSKYTNPFAALGWFLIYGAQNSIIIKHH